MERFRRSTGKAGGWQDIGGGKDEIRVKTVFKLMTSSWLVDEFGKTGGEGKTVSRLTVFSRGWFNWKAIGNNSISYLRSAFQSKALPYTLSCKSHNDWKVDVIIPNSEMFRKIFKIWIQAKRWPRVLFTSQCLTGFSKSPGVGWWCYHPAGPLINEINKSLTIFIIYLNESHPFSFLKIILWVEAKEYFERLTDLLKIMVL